MDSIDIYIIILFVFVAGLFTACANRVSPTGGDKDVASPKVLGIHPLNRSTNFSTDEITILFDEFVRLKGQSSEVFISPAVKNKPDFKLRGKKLIVKFKEPLKENTTYTINFGNSIEDITEGNKLRNFEYAFSTGDIIDSLRIKGKVKYAEDNLPAKNILVGLYETSSDTLFRTSIPRYIGRTGEDGTFNINNIEAGQYQLFALEDKNGSMFYDQGNENIAFLNEHIVVDDSTRTYQLEMFNENKAPHKLVVKKNRDYGFIDLVYTKPLDSLDIKVDIEGIKPEDLTIIRSEQNDSINIFFRNVETDTVTVWLNGSEGVQDTVVFKRLVKRDKLTKLKQTPNMRIGRTSSNIDLDKKPTLTFTHPIDSIDYDKIQFLEDSVALDVKAIVKQNPDNTKQIIFDHIIKPDAEYILFIPDSTITDFYGLKYKQINYKFKAYNIKKYGTLNLKYKNRNPDYNYILTLKDKDGRIKIKHQNITGKEQLVKYINPNQYTAYIIEDKNRDGKWTPGDYDKKIQPERVISSNTITVKGNWDSELDVDLK